MFRKVVKFLRREPKMTDDSSVTKKGYLSSYQRTGRKSVF